MQQRWVGAAVLVLLIAGAAVYATIPDAQGVIHGCYAAGGQLRIIDSANTSCRAGETSLQLAAAAAVMCPAGTVRFVGVCIETTSRSADIFTDATRDCADEARRLPSGAELKGFGMQPGITLNGFEWADDLGDTTSSSVFVYVVAGELGDAVQEASTPMPYRCVAGPQLQ